MILLVGRGFSADQKKRMQTLGKTWSSFGAVYLAQRAAEMAPIGSLRYE